MFRRLALASVALGVAFTVAPAQAAPGSTNLYFANVQEGSQTGCTPVYALATVQTDGGECSGTLIGVNGTGLIQNDTYASVKKVSFKVDTSRSVTGTIWVQHFAAARLSAAPNSSLPGYVDLDVTIKFGSVTVGKVTGTGVTTPTGGLEIKVDLPIPAALKGQTITKVTAAVTWRTALGLSGISYSAPNASLLTIPTR